MDHDNTPGVAELTWGVATVVEAATGARAPDAAKINAGYGAWAVLTAAVNTPSEKLMFELTGVVEIVGRTHTLPAC